MSNNSRFKGKTILILDGQARQILPFIREFKKAGCKVTVLCRSRLDCGYVSRLPDKKIVIKHPDDDEFFNKAVIKIIKSRSYDLVLPIIETTVTFISKYKKELSCYAYIAISDYDCLKIAQDKLKVMKLCTENDIPCAKTLFNINNINDVRKSGINFPLIIKPRTSYGSMGFKRFDSIEQFEEYVEDNNIDLKDMVIQECIPDGSLVMADNIYVDKNGEIKSSFLYGCKRVFPVHGGTGCLNVSFNRPEIHKNCAKLVKLVGLRGCVGVDLMIDNRDDTAKVIEINPRILACAKIGFEAGVNQARQILEEAFGDSVTPMMDYKSDIRIRMSQIDILWFIKSESRFHTEPSWFSIKNTKDQMFSWDDPLPWFAFLIQGLTKLKKKLNDRNQ